MIDAVIIGAVRLGSSIRGNIYCDRKGRFLDGQPITTSPIIREDGPIITTKNSEYYVVWAEERFVKPVLHPEGRFDATVLEVRKGKASNKSEWAYSTCVVETEHGKLFIPLAYQTSSVAYFSEAVAEAAVGVRLHVQVEHKELDGMVMASAYLVPAP